jgi:hypothetical protein
MLGAGLAEAAPDRATAAAGLACFAFDVSTRAELTTVVEGVGLGFLTVTAVDGFGLGFAVFTTQALPGDLLGAGTEATGRVPTPCDLQAAEAGAAAATARTATKAIPTPYRSTFVPWTMGMS